MRYYVPDKVPLEQKSLLLIYYSLIYSSIIYCNTKHHKRRRQPGSTQTPVSRAKRQGRAIEGLKKRDYTNDAFLKYKILNLADVNTFNCAIFVYKSLNYLIWNCC